MSKNRPHAIAQAKLNTLLVRLVPAAGIVAPEQPIAIGDDKVPEPDLTVVRGTPDDYPRRPPAGRDVALVIEVSDTSLKKDLGTMMAVYAGQAIPVYWVVNLARGGSRSTPSRRARLLSLGPVLRPGRRSARGARRSRGGPDRRAGRPALKGAACSRDWSRRWAASGRRRGGRGPAADRELAGARHPPGARRERGGQRLLPDGRLGRGGRFDVQAGPETLLRTNLGDLDEGSPVNLERSLRVGDRLGGHFVQGHVDATAVLRTRRAEGDWQFLAFAIDPPWTALMVPKGSIAVDGVSLTLVAVEDDGFSVMLIPHTLAVTTLGLRRPGDRVNIEADILAKHVRKLMEHLP
jgi:riboflavin synthase